MVAKTWADLLLGRRKVCKLAEGARFLEHVWEGRDPLKVEWLILADAAEVVGNKLYLLGGGWDRLTVHTGFPLAQRVAIAISVMVPWESTQQEHDFVLLFATPEGKVMADIKAVFEVGRPPGVTPGRAQRWQLAGEVNLEILGPGRHVVVARIDGEEGARQEFDVVSGRRAADLPG